MEYYAKISAVEAQRLTIRLLTLLPDAALENLLLRMEPSGSAEGQKQLSLCIGAAIEQREDSACYDGLSRLCGAALRRQGNSGMDLREAMGISKMQKSRLQRDRTALTLEHIRKLCSRFQDEAEQRFWENMFLDRYPDIPDLGRSGGQEEAALRELCTLLEAREYHTAAEQLSSEERRALEKLALAPPGGLDLQRFGPEKDRLYPVITALAAAIRRLLADIASEELCIYSMNTWYAWKKAWEQAEAAGFRESLPRNRLKRVHLLQLAVVFGLSYLESVYFLALAGYRYISGEPDDTVLEYMRGSGRSSQEVRQYVKGWM